MFVDHEPGDAPAQAYLDLVSVTVDDGEEAVAVRWQMAGAVPEETRWPDGQTGSNLWAVFVIPPGDTLGYSLQVNQNGADWSVEVVDMEASAASTVVARPADARSGENAISATFPNEYLPRVSPVTRWFALSEGDGDLDPEFDFSLPLSVQDRCPAAPRALDAEPTLAFR